MGTYHRGMRIRSGTTLWHTDTIQQYTLVALAPGQLPAKNENILKQPSPSWFQLYPKKLHSETSATAGPRFIYLFFFFFLPLFLFLLLPTYSLYTGCMLPKIIPGTIELVYI